MKHYTTLLICILSTVFPLYSSEKLEHTKQEDTHDTEWEIIPTNSVKEKLQQIRHDTLEYATDRIKKLDTQEAANNEVCARKFRNLFKAIEKLENDYPSMKINMKQILEFAVIAARQITPSNIAQLTTNLLELDEN